MAISLISQAVRGFGMAPANARAQSQAAGMTPPGMVPAASLIRERAAWDAQRQELVRQARELEAGIVRAKAVLAVEKTAHETTRKAMQERLDRLDAESTARIFEITCDRDEYIKRLVRVLGELNAEKTRPVRGVGEAAGILWRSVKRKIFK